MTIHHQDNNYLTYQSLTEHRYSLSMDDVTPDHIIDRQTISDINTRSKTGLQRYITRQNKAAKIIYKTLTLIA
jgi:hypothetical protein